MKKIILSIALALALPSLVLAAFSPATLTDGYDRVAVYTKAQADKLFSQGYVLETKTKELGVAIGEYFSPVAFLGGMRHTEQVKSIAKTDIVATTTLTLADSGTTYYLSASGTTIILPAVTKKGANFRFVVGGALDTGNVIIDSAEGDNIDGTLIVAGAVVDCRGEDQINFVTDGEEKGDYVEVRSNGTQWFIGDSGVLTTAKMTCTDPS